MPAWFVKFRSRDMPMVDHQLPVRRDHIDMLRLQRHAALDLRDRHFRSLREDLRQFALPRRIEMDNDDKRRFAVVG